MAVCKICKKSEVSMLCICQECIEELQTRNKEMLAQNRELTEKIEQLEADLRGKDNEIDI